MVSRIRPWASLLWVWTDAVLRSNPSWIWMHAIILSIPMWLWIEEVCGPNPLCMRTEEMLASNSGPSPVVTSPESQRVVTEPPLDRTGSQHNEGMKSPQKLQEKKGDMDRPCEGDLTKLPDDLVEAILANLSLHELARVSTTCSAFQAVCRRQIAQEQKTRCDLAVGCVGRGRLVYLALIIDRFVKGETVGPELAEKGKDAEWLLVREMFDGRKCDRMYNAADMMVRIWLEPRGNRLLLRLPTLKGNLLQLYIELHLSPDELTINVTNIGEEDAFSVMEGTAILQTLLSGVFAPPLSEPGLQIGVCAKRYFFFNKSPQGRMHVRGDPCVSMPTCHTFAAVGLGAAKFRHEHIQVYQVGYYGHFGEMPYSTRKLHLRMAVCSTPPTQGLLHHFMQFVSEVFS